MGFWVRKDNYSNVFKIIQFHQFSVVLLVIRRKKSRMIQKVSLFHEHSNTFVTVLNLYNTKRQAVRLKTIHFRELKAWKMWRIILGSLIEWSARTGTFTLFITLLVVFASSWQTVSLSISGCNESCRLQIIFTPVGGDKCLSLDKLNNSFNWFIQKTESFWKNTSSGLY